LHTIAHYDMTCIYVDYPTVYPLLCYVMCPLQKRKLGDVHSCERFQQEPLPPSTNVLKQWSKSQFFKAAAKHHQQQPPRLLM